MGEKDLRSFFEKRAELSSVGYKDETPAQKRAREEMMRVRFRIEALELARQKNNQ